MKRLCSFLFLALACEFVHGAAPPAAPVPKSPSLPLIYRYADTLLERGRDTNGVFLGALDRHTFESRPATTFCDQQNLLRLLYTLSELSSKPKYREAADAALRAFLKTDPSGYSRAWMLWNRSFEIAPEASTQFASRLVKERTNAHPGFWLRTWSAAYSRTTNEIFRGAIEELVPGFENSMSASLAIDCEGSARLLP